MDMEKQMQLIRAGNFKENNGSVMRTINMLRYQYHKLKSVEYALPDITKGEITDSVNYLYEAGYIHLRTVLSKSRLRWQTAILTISRQSLRQRGSACLPEVSTTPA